MPNRGGKCRYGILPTRKPKRLAETITMNIPNMFPPGKASWPIIDQRTAQIKITTSPRVATWPKNPLGGTIPASRNRFFKPESFTVSSFLDSVVVWSSHTGLSMTNLWKKCLMTQLYEMAGDSKCLFCARRHKIKVERSAGSILKTRPLPMS